jgi:DNA-directed RNA polymerase subunit RPC12/RpoP
MSEAPPPPPDAGAVDSKGAGRTIDDGKARVFPCEGCGADLEFNIGVQHMKCPYCGYEKEIEISEDAEIVEQDFHDMLARLSEMRLQKREKEADGDGEDDTNEIRCSACGGTVVFVGSLTSSECPYCASPIQLENVHDAEDRIPVDGVLPFLIDLKVAKTNLGEWVQSRWFAPNEFRRRGVDGKFNGVYLPYWTFDTFTANHYVGQRGEHYTVTVGSGDKKRTETRTRWYPASGAFQRFFDDVLVLATEGLPRKLMQALEPWPLHECKPFAKELLAGYLARTYEVELDGGFSEAKQRIDGAIEQEVRKRIGGDEQRIHSINTRYDALTFKHLLLPVWLLAYRYNEKPYQVMINAGTGEVQGERPYSWVKITLAVVAGLAVIGTAVYFFQQ